MLKTHASLTMMLVSCAVLPAACNAVDIRLFEGLEGGTEPLGPGGAGGAPPPGSDIPTSGGAASDRPRNPRLWPFSESSIWNTPLGNEAVYVPAELAETTAVPFAVVDVIIVMEPDAPLTSIHYNPNGYAAGADRCSALGDELFQAPIPVSFVVPDGGPGTPNREATFLLADGRSLLQAEPFYRCSSGEHGTALVGPFESDLLGDGIAGPSGGSGLSSMGGTLRLGELRPGGEHVRHALRVHVDEVENLWNCSLPDDCYRWPASKSNSNAVDTFGGSNPALKSGSLVAIPISEDVASWGLETEVAAELAWTLQHFGAYVVNGTGWSTRTISTEWSPQGRFIDQFSDDWGIDLPSLPFDSPFARDLALIFSQLAVVDNNSSSTPGGGGERVTDPPPPLDSL